MWLLWPVIGFGIKESYDFIWKKCFKSNSVRYWEPDWLFRFTIDFQLNNGKNIWSSLKMQWQLPHLTNDYTVWPWSAKQKCPTYPSQCYFFIQFRKLCLLLRTKVYIIHENYGISFIPRLSLNIYIHRNSNLTFFAHNIIWYDNLNNTYFSSFKSHNSKEYLFSHGPH